MEEQIKRKRGRPPKNKPKEEPVLLIPTNQEKVAKQETELKLLELVVSSNYTLFKFADKVQKIEKLRTPLNNILMKGIVLRHDLNSRWVFVEWNDGTKYWIDASGLELIRRMKE